MYTDGNVADGFYDSISSLKTLPPSTSPSFASFAEDHRHIIEICKAGEKIPRISDTMAEELLKQIRPGVSDYFSISAAHYLNGGLAAIRHFRFLFNSVLSNIEVASIDEMNRAHAVILHKGHACQLAPPWSPHASFSPTPTAAPWLKSGSDLGCLTTGQVPTLQGSTVHWFS